MFACMQVHPLALLEISRLLDVSPRELRCPFMPFEVVECPVTLTNGTDYYVSVWITASCQDIFSYIHVEGYIYFYVESWQGENPWRLCMMQPHSSYLMTMVMKKQLRPRKDTCKFAVQMIVMPSKIHHTKLESDIGIMVDLCRDNHGNTRHDLDRDSDVDIMNRTVYMDDDVDSVNRKVDELGGKV